VARVCLAPPGHSLLLNCSPRPTDRSSPALRVPPPGGVAGLRKGPAGLATGAGTPCSSSSNGITRPRIRLASPHPGPAISRYLPSGRSVERRSSIAAPSEVLEVAADSQYSRCHTVNGPGARGGSAGAVLRALAQVSRADGSSRCPTAGPAVYGDCNTSLCLSRIGNGVVQIATPPAVRRRCSVWGGGAVVPDVQA